MAGVRKVEATKLRGLGQVAHGSMDSQTVGRWRAHKNSVIGVLLLVGMFCCLG